MMMPVLLYGAETWFVTQQELRKLDAFQMKCLQEIVGVTLWDRRRNVDILEETGELPVEEQLGHKGLQWFGHLQRMPETQPQKQVLRCRPHGSGNLKEPQSADRPSSQGPVQPSSMERACEEQISMAIHHSTASLAGQLTDKRRLHTTILPNVCACVCVSVYEVCPCVRVCLRVFVYIHLTLPSASYPYNDCF